MRPFTFPGKVCFITGAASGIGEALALDLAARGASLALLDRDADNLQRVADAAKSRGAATISTHVVDLSDHGDRLDLANDVLDTHGRVDLVVNNAGVALGGTFDQLTLADFDWLMEINFTATVRITKAFLPHLRANPGSHLVNLSSLFGLIAPAGQTAYAASKHAVRGFTEALRQELRADDVGVTVVHPGGIKTNIARNARIAKAAAAQAGAEEGRANFDKLLTLPPSQAARQILDAVHQRRGRLVITGPAKVADLLVRATPAHYWTIINTLGRLAGR